MKNLFSYFFIVSIITLIACNLNTDPENNTKEISNAASYFPGALNSFFIYDQNVNNLGFTREAYFARMDKIGNVEYVVQRNNSYADGGIDSVITELYFRRSTDGIYFAIDTTGISEFIPDSIISEYQLALSIDPEINMFSTQGLSAGEWDAFKFNISASLFGQNLTITVVEVTAIYEGEESISVPALANNENAVKIRFNTKIRIPDPNDLATFLNPTIQEFNTTVWFVENVGLSKMEGSALLANVIGQGSIDFEDSTLTVSEVLSYVDLK